MTGASCSISSISSNFNPHTPYGVWPLFFRLCMFRQIFQSTHPLRSVTSIRLQSPICRDNFNPHTPYGVWLFHLRQIFPCLHISIHTPLTECDCRDICFPLKFHHFNPHTPYGVWQDDDFIKIVKDLFQSTHPLRSVTLLISSLSITTPISIHTPLTECDQKWRFSFLRKFKFQSTHPLRSVTRSIFLMIFRPYISIHTPLTECDVPILLLHF